MVMDPQQPHWGVGGEVAVEKGERVGGERDKGMVKRKKMKRGEKTYERERKKR